LLLAEVASPVVPYPSSRLKVQGQVMVISEQHNRDGCFVSLYWTPEWRGYRSGRNDSAPVSLIDA